MNGENNKVKNRYIIYLVFFLTLILFLIFPFRSSEHNFDSYTVEEVTTPKVTILFAGDMMLDRNVRNIIDRKGFEYFFGGVSELIKSADISVGNLEGAFTDFPSVTASLTSKELVFTFDPKLAPKLFDLGFDILGLANNHTYNFGNNGLESTRRHIGSSGMLYYGDPFNKDEISTIITKSGIRIGIVGFHEFYYTNFDKVYAEISRLRSEVDVLIVTPHWGIEYNVEPSKNIREWAHKFIDSGADVVIGTHQHVVGSTEIYKGKKIYYSLGNFAFDQYFSKATMQGLVVIIDIDKGNEAIDINFTDVPVYVDREGVRVLKSSL